MQQAFGGDQLTEEDLQKILRGPNSPFGQAGMGGAGGLGMGQIAPVNAPQPVGHANFGPSGRGPNKDLMDALLGKSSEYNSATGDWTMGPQGFPMPGGGSPSLGTRLGGMVGK